MLARCHRQWQMGSKTAPTKCCQLITTGRWRLWSPNVATCEVPGTHTRLGNWFFSAAGPRLWNNLPLHLCDFELSLLEFHRLLKMHLFGWGLWHLVTIFRYSAFYKCTYLLNGWCWLTYIMAVKHFDRRHICLSLLILCYCFIIIIACTWCHFFSSFTEMNKFSVIRDIYLEILNSSD